MIVNQTGRIKPPNASMFLKQTPERDYWLGFLMADGWVHKNTLGISLHKKDSAHLESFRSWMQYDYPIRYKQGVDNRGVPYNTATIAMSSEELVRNLEVFGIVPRKSGRESCPNNLQTNRDFWRGCIDGDGSISIATTRRKDYKWETPRLSFCGSKVICESFLSFCETVQGFKRRGSYLYEKKTYSVVDFTGLNAALVMDLCYKESKTVLYRKKNRYQELKAKFPKIWEKIDQ